MFQRCRWGYLGALCVTLAAGMPSAGLAQDTSASEGSDALQEVTVTARKRVESLQDVPIAITTFGADDIEAANLTGLQDLSQLAAGFQFMNQGNQQPGRYNTQLQFRGMTTAQFSPSFATGALFIDGIYVLNGGTSLPLMDVERVEVIKGPQAAYFGRNTFGGAVNLITRRPNMKELTGEVSISTTDRSNNEISGYLSGPIVEDRIAFNLSGRLYDKQGHFTATDRGRLGDEQTTTLNGSLLLTPSERLAVRINYSHSEDEDGAPAQGFISGILNDTCTGTTITTAAGQTANPVRYICGQVPGPNNAITDPGFSPSSANTILPANIGAFFANTPALPAGVTGVSLPKIDHIGLVRRTERANVNFAYNYNDYEFELTAGYNEQAATWIRDFDLSDRLNWFSRDPQYMEDQSYEFRVSSPQQRRFSWLLGVNRYKQEFVSAGEGGHATTSCFSTSPTLTDSFATCIPNFALSFANTTLANADRAEVTGFFGSVDFKMTDQFTVILEGRQQQDKLTKGGGLSNPGQPLLTDEFKKFLPRFIVRWEPTDATTVYASYAEGMIAGDFNTSYIDADARERAQYLAQDPTIKESLEAETNKALELGWKQRFADGRVQLNVAIYENKWKNIKGRSSFLINETCDATGANAIGVTGCTFPGVQPGDPKMIDDGTGTLIPFFNSRNILLPGDATIRGLEVETLWRPVRNLNMALNFAYIDSKYDNYIFNFVAPFAGFSQMAGNRTPRQPEWSGNASATYDFRMGSQNAYVRGDLVYQGETFVDESNLASLADYTVVNLRGGIEKDNYRVELFVKNLFDEDAWQTGARWTDFSSPTQFAFLTAKQGVAVTPLDRREVGLRFNYKF
ncbi:MAG: TonB-dependent receptor [Steroidobacteraceae bacterium]